MLRERSAASHSRLIDLLLGRAIRERRVHVRRVLVASESQTRGRPGRHVQHNTARTSASYWLHDYASYTATSAVVLLYSLIGVVAM